MVSKPWQMKQELHCSNLILHISWGKSSCVFCASFIGTVPTTSRAAAPSIPCPPLSAGRCSGAGRWRCGPRHGAQAGERRSLLRWLRAAGHGLFIPSSLPSPSIFSVSTAVFFWMFSTTFYYRHLENKLRQTLPGRRDFLETEGMGLVLPSCPAAQPVPGHCLRVPRERTRMSVVL